MADKTCIVCGAVTYNDATRCPIHSTPQQSRWGCAECGTPIEPDQLRCPIHRPKLPDERDP